MARKRKKNHSVTSHRRKVKTKTGYTTTYVRSHRRGYGA
jgi:hypothetical protein